jgi:predicted RNase H-like nuclease (RuvC/YqgF family)
MGLFNRKEKETKEVADFYELCFEDFQRRTHNTIQNLIKENKELAAKNEFLKKKITMLRKECAKLKNDELTSDEIKRLLFCIDLIIQNYGENAELEKIYDKLIKIRSDVK